MQAGETADRAASPPTSVGVEKATALVSGLCASASQEKLQPMLLILASVMISNGNWRRQTDWKRSEVRGSVASHRKRAAVLTVRPASDTLMRFSWKTATLDDETAIALNPVRFRVKCGLQVPLGAGPAELTNLTKIQTSIRQSRATTHNYHTP